MVYQHIELRQHYIKLTCCYDKNIMLGYDDSVRSHSPQIPKAVLQITEINFCISHHIQCFSITIPTLNDLVSTLDC